MHEQRLFTCVQSTHNCSHKETVAWRRACTRACGAKTHVYPVINDETNDRVIRIHTQRAIIRRQRRRRQRQRRRRGGDSPPNKIYRSTCDRCGMSPFVAVVVVVPLCAAGWLLKRASAIKPSGFTAELRENMLCIDTLRFSAPANIVVAHMARVRSRVCARALACIRPSRY